MVMLADFFIEEIESVAHLFVVLNANLSVEFEAYKRNQTELFLLKWKKKNNIINTIRVSMP